MIFQNRFLKNFEILDYASILLSTYFACSQHAGRLLIIQKARCLLNHVASSQKHAKTGKTPHG